MEHVPPSQSEVDKFELRLGEFVLEAEAVKQLVPDAADLLDRQVQHLRAALALRYGIDPEVDGLTTVIDTDGRTPWLEERLETAVTDARAVNAQLAAARESGVLVGEDAQAWLAAAPLAEIIEMNGLLAMYVADGETYTRGSRWMVNTNLVLTDAGWQEAPLSPEQEQRKAEQAAKAARPVRFPGRSGPAPVPVVADEDRFLRPGPLGDYVSAPRGIAARYPDAEDPYVSFDYWVDNGTASAAAVNLEKLMAAGGVSSRVLDELHRLMVSAATDRLVEEGKLAAKDRWRLESSVTGKISPAALQAFVEVTAGCGDDFRNALLRSVRFDGDMAALVSSAARLIEAGIPVAELSQASGPGFGTPLPVDDILEKWALRSRQRDAGRAASGLGR